jgi:hypothetical protein
MRCSRFSSNVFEDQKSRALVLAYFEKFADERMIERRHCPCLASETLTRGFVFGQVPEQHLDGDTPIQMRIMA